MEISLERKTMTAYNAAERTEKLCEISCDIVVPDTNEDIIRLLLTRAKYKLLSKDIANKRVSVSGELEICTAYLPESGEGISMLSCVSPFDCSFDSACDDDGDFVFADIAVVGTETRILNPRKISVKVKLLVRIKCYSLSTLEWYEKPENSEFRAFFREQSISSYVCDIACEKQFTLQNDFEYNEVGDNDAVLSSSVSYKADSAEAVGIKLIVKGHCDLKLILIGDGKLKSIDKTVPFSQIFDLTERDVLPEFSVNLLPTGDSIELKDGFIIYELHGLAQLVCRNKTEATFVSDAYLCGKSCELNMQSIKLITEMCENEEVKAAKMSYDGDTEIMSTVLSEAIIGRARKNESGTVIPITVDAVFMTADSSLRSCRLFGEAETEFDDDSITDVSVISLDSRVNSNELNVTAEIKIISKSCKTESFDCVSSILSDEKENDKNASVYLARAQDSLWDLGKKYCADLELIRKINGIEDDVIPDRLLLIPND